MIYTKPPLGGPEAMLTYLSRYTPPELDALLDETRVLTDMDARKAKVQKVFKYLLENVIHVPLYKPGWEWVFAVRP